MTQASLQGAAKTAFINSSRRKIAATPSEHMDDRLSILTLLSLEEEISLATITNTVRAQYKDKLGGMQINKEASFFNAIFSTQTNPSGQRDHSANINRTLPPKRRFAAIAFTRTAESVKAWEAGDYGRTLRKGVGRAVSEIVNRVIRLPGDDFSEQQVVDIVNDVIKHSNLDDEAKQQLRDEFTGFLKKLNGDAEPESSTTEEYIVTR